MQLHRIFYFLLIAIKWPLAFLSLTLLPSLALALWQEILLDISSLMYVFFGVAAYFSIWWFSIKHWTIDWLSTLEHELTHCIFAWMTGNKVGEIKVTFRSGGHITVIGSPNWLIDVAPYFFPTVTVTLLFLAPAIPTLNVVWRQLAVGITLAYHITSTLTETHSGQTDLQKAGFAFCWMFLPAANLACLGCILACASRGWSGVNNYWLSVVANASSSLGICRLFGIT